MNKHVYSGTAWEKQVAYSRARRVGNNVYVAGTTAVDEEGNVVAPGDVYEQTRFVFRKIARALDGCEAGLSDVVRTRMFITDIGRFEEMARAHREAFEGIDPVATCVEVSALVSPEIVIEIEVDAVIYRPDGGE
ncbi:MAG: RidA family protein [Pyrinomonadaceae bacterium]